MRRATWKNDAKIAAAIGASGGGGSVSAATLDYEGTHAAAIFNDVAISEADDPDGILSVSGTDFTLTEGTYLILGSSSANGGSGSKTVEVNFQGDGGSFQGAAQSDTDTAHDNFSWSKIVDLTSGGVAETTFAIQSYIPTGTGTTVKGRVTFIKLA